MRHMELAEKNENQTIFGLEAMKKESSNFQFALCIEHGGCEDLEKRKIYQILPDEQATQEGYLRVVDESDEDYLYPESYFVRVELPRRAKDAWVAAT